MSASISRNASRNVLRLTTAIPPVSSASVRNVECCLRTYSFHSVARRSKSRSGMVVSPRTSMVWNETLARFAASISSSSSLCSSESLKTSPNASVVVN